MTWLDGTLYALDTETTSPDPEEARILTACLGASSRPGDWQPHEYRMNPGVPVGDSERIHWISDERASQWPDPAEQLGDLWAELVMIQGSPIVGHNVSYDATVLDREFRRHLGKGLPKRLLFLDTLVLYRRLDWTTGGRRLENLAERHGINFPAHDSTADALASLRILHILAMRNDVLPHLPLDALQALQARWYAEQVQHMQDKYTGTGYVGTYSTDWPVRPHREEGEAA